MPWISCLLMLAVTSCGGNGPVDKKAANTAGLPDVNVAAPSATGEPHVPTVPAAAAPASATSVTIPVAFRGRWGMTPADCMPGRSDAKGLLIINAGELRFYESRAVPAADVDTDADSITGTFAFTGEGQSWTQFEALKVDKGLLTRTETKPTASFSYAKCS